MTSWHDNAAVREAVGKTAESDFASSIVCHCGGRFKFIGDSYPGCPDFTCDICGQLVDVKISPQAERTGNLAVSVIPWRHYPDDLLLVTIINGRWLGEYKQHIQIVSGDRAPTHASTGTRLKNTRFNLISWKTFRTLADLGYRRR